VDWKPQEVSFYTVAAPERNPLSEAVWTAPYNDFAGAGLMVTNSAPIYVKDKLVGVMSHDFRIEDLQKQCSALRWARWAWRSCSINGETLSPTEIMLPKIRRSAKS